MKFLVEKNLPIQETLEQIKRNHLENINPDILNKSFVKVHQKIAVLDSELENLKDSNNLVYADLLKGDVYYNTDEKAFCASKQGFINISGTIITIEPIYIISNDLMKLYLVLTSNMLEKVDKELLFHDLEELNCPYLDKKIIENIFIEKKSGIFIVAKGKKPIDGNCEKIIPLFDDKLQAGKLDEKGNIDFFERNFLRSFKKGDTIAKIIPEKLNEDGYDIFGKTIPSKYDNDPVFICGANVEKNEGFVIAASDGVLSLAGKVINIHSLVKINGDASLYTGNINCKSSILITGNILENIDVYVEGDLIVKGVISSCNSLHVKGNLICNGGIIGKAKTLYSCEGVLYSKYIRNATFFVKRDCIVEDDIMNSTLFVNKNLICYAKKGVILSSIIHCSKDIITKNLGNDHGNINKIYLGHSYLAEQNLQIIQKLIKEAQKIENEKIKKFKMDMLNKYEKRISSKIYNLQSHLFVIKTIFQDNILVGPLFEHKVDKDYNEVAIHYKGGPSFNIMSLPIKIKDRIENIIKSMNLLQVLDEKFSKEEILEKTAEKKDIKNSK
ncbi:MAG TPA: FapA family protein [Exilispira sp.]|nr:FapA family protein [Exilispira sp.]